MRNRWGVELKKGYYAWVTGPRGGKYEGTITAIDRTSNMAKAYGPRVTLNDSMTVGADDVSQVLPPMRVDKRGVVKANPATNPTPRLKRYDQPSQRFRISERGTPTKTPSKRLKNRRLITHHFAPPGTWANPVERDVPNSRAVMESDIPSLVRGWRNVFLLQRRAPGESTLWVTVGFNEKRRDAENRLRDMARADKKSAFRLVTPD